MRELILGPAGSGKTGWSVEKTAEVCHAGVPLVVILPAQSLIQDFRQRLLSHPDFTASDQLRLVTFYSLVKTIAPLAGITHQELDKSQLALTLEHYLVRNTESYPELLKHEITDGFINTVLDYFSDLQDGNVSARQVRDTLAGNSMSNRRLRELHHLYIQFSTYISDNGFLSRPQLFLKVTKWLKNQSKLPLGNHFLIDGFYDFNPVQQSIVETLVQKSEYCGITALYDEHKVFEYPRETVQWLSKQVKSAGGTIQKLSQNTGPLPEIETLFEENRTKQTPPETFRLVEASTAAIEIQETVRSVKQALLSDALDSQEIAILYRGGDEYYSALLNKCRQEGIPISGSHEEPLAQNPAVAAIMQWYEVLTNRFARDDVIRWVQSSYVDLRTGKISLKSEEFERYSRLARIIEGKSHWIERLHQYADRENRPDIRQYADRLSQIWNQLPETKKASWPNHLRDLNKVIRLVHIRELLQETGTDEILIEHLARDARALDALFKLIEDIEQLVTAFPLEPLSTQQFVKKFRELLRSSEYKERNGHNRGITITDIQTARGHYWKRVYLVGLVDEVFPIRSRAHPMVKLQDRMRINEILQNHGQVVEHRADLREEQLLFYIALTRATEFVQVSTITGNEKILPSPFYETLIQFYSNDKNSVPVPTKIGSHTIKFQPENSWLQVDLLQHLSHLENFSEANQPIHLSHFQHLQKVDQLRNSTQFSVYDGELADGHIREQIQKQYNVSESISPSRIELYYQSPFHYFIKYILGLTELEDITDELPPQERGSLLHEIMEQFYSSLPDEFNGKVTPENLDSSRKFLERVIDAVFAEFEARGLPIPELLWQSESQKIRQYAWNAVRFFATKYPWSDSHITPGKFEFGFGFPDEESKPALKLKRDDDLIRLRGKVDRLDINRENGQFLVVDYKTSSGKRVKDFFNGKAVQLQVYALAAQRLLDEYEEPVRLSYYSFKKGEEDSKVDIKSQEKKKKPNPMDSVEELIWDAMDNIRAGIFHPVEGECSKYCPVKHICHCDENRIRGKRAGGEE